MREITFVDTFFPQHAPGGAEQRYRGDRCRIEKLAVGDSHRQLLDLAGRQLLWALRAGGEDGADDRAGRSARHALDDTAGFRQCDSRLNKYVLLDSNMRREIMKVFTAGNDHIAEMFLTASDADALAFHDDTSKATIPDDELILTYEELVKLLVAMQHLMAKKP